MKSLTVPAVTEQLDAVQSFIAGELDAYGCSPRAAFQIALAVEEIFTNIARYAYRPEVGEATVRCEVRGRPTQVVIQFLDGGRPFDPLAGQDADTSEQALLNRDGGLGILLVKKSMDEVSYAYENGRNVLTIRKNM